MRYINIVFDGPPDHDAPCFIEIEDENGNSLSIGEWLPREDGYWNLQIPVDQYTLVRQLLKRNLGRLPEECHTLFKLMYCEPLNPQKRTPAVIEKIKSTLINTVVDRMPDDKLNWALQQVTRTLEKQLDGNL